MTSDTPEKPADGRLGELRQQLLEESFVPGPLDCSDLHAALSELIDRRIAETSHVRKPPHRVTA